MVDARSTVPARILPAITVAQFAGSSLWFAINAVVPDLQREQGLSASAAGTFSAAVQLGFVTGTLVFAVLGIADRFSARLVFLLCCVGGAACTALSTVLAPQMATLVVLRFITGFVLAGIYPLGMKIAASWYTQGLGAALGIMIAAGMVGTAFPHALRAVGAELPWREVMWGVTILACAGGLLLYLLVPDKPGMQSSRSGLQLDAFKSMWTRRALRAPVLGYFGHMWELYTMWVLVPVIVATRFSGSDVSWGAFFVIAAGAIGCVVGGAFARRAGSAAVASVQIAVSGACCLVAPWMLDAPVAVFVAWLVVWGVTVVGDSPQFSTLIARNAPSHAVGSVLALGNCIGFTISMVSIDLFSRLAQNHSLGGILQWLAVGPLLGFAAMVPTLRLRER